MAKEKTFTVECEDTTYKFKLMKTKKALRIGFKLNSLILPTVGATVDDLKKDEFAHGARSTFKDAANMIVSRLDELEVEELIEELFDECTVDGDEIDFDTHFQGKLDELVTCTEAVIKENFSSLFTGKTKDILGKVMNLL